MKIYFILFQTNSKLFVNKESRPCHAKTTVEELAKFEIWHLLVHFETIQPFLML